MKTTMTKAQIKELFNAANDLRKAEPEGSPERKRQLEMMFLLADVMQTMN